MYAVYIISIIPPLYEPIPMHFFSLYLANMKKIEEIKQQMVGIEPRKSNHDTFIFFNILKLFIVESWMQGNRPPVQQQVVVDASESDSK